MVDSVGSHTLANACAQTKAEGVVAACGLAQGMDLPGTVAPFILRGVTLAGINSVTAPRARRERAWQRAREGARPDAARVDDEETASRVRSTRRPRSSPARSAAASSWT